MMGVDRGRGHSHRRDKISRNRGSGGQQNPGGSELLDRLSSPKGVHTENQRGRAGTVEPVERPGRADAAFIGMEDGTHAERFFDRSLEQREVLIFFRREASNGNTSLTEAPYLQPSSG